MITVTSNFDNLILNANYMYKDRLKRLSGAVFDWEIKAWVIPKTSLGELQSAFDGELYFKTPLWKILGYDAPEKEEYTFSSNVDLPTLEITPYEYQKDAMRFLIDRINHYGFGLCADDVGLGKTIESIGTMEYFMGTAGVKKVLIVCKKSIKRQWASEIRKVTGDMSLPIYVTPADTKKKRDAVYQAAREVDSCILITNYHNFLNDYQAIDSIPFDFVIVDEVHSVKGHDTKMNRRIGSVAHGKKTILLTGTPIMSKPADIFGIVRIAARNYFGTYRDFAKRYLVLENTQYGERVIGAKNLNELHDRIKAFMIRRTVDDVDIELPDVITQTIKCEEDAIQDIIIDSIERKKRQLMAERDNYTKGENEMLTPEDIANIQAIEDQAKQFISASQFAADDPRVFLYTSNTQLNASLRTMVPKDYKMSAKTEATIDIVEDILNADKKVIIFSHFKVSAKLLAEDLKAKLKTEVLLYTGDENEEVRERNIKRFWSSDKANILIGTEAMAEGLNLQKASHIINFEQPDTYAQKTQRMGRARRVGSEHKHVYVYDMVTEGTYDENKINKIERDKDLADLLVEGK